MGTSEFLLLLSDELPADNFGTNTHCRMILTSGRTLFALMGTSSRSPQAVR